MTAPKPIALTFTPPTTNDDGSPLAVGEVTGFEVGVFATSDTTQPEVAKVTLTATQTGTDLAALGLKPGTYFASVRTLSANDSIWDPAIQFVVPVPVPTPNPPSNFTIAS